MFFEHLTKTKQTETCILRTDTGGVDLKQDRQRPDEDNLEGGLANHQTFPHYFCKTFPYTVSYAGFHGATILIFDYSL